MRVIASPPCPILKARLLDNQQAVSPGELVKGKLSTRSFQNHSLLHYVVSSRLWSIDFFFFQDQSSGVR